MPKTYQELELFSVNAKLFHKCRLIGSPSKITQLLVAIVPFFTGLGQLLKIIVTLDENISETGLNFYKFAVIANSIIRQSIIVLNDEKFVRLLRLVERWYRDIEFNENPDVLCKLRDVTKRAQMLTRVCFILAFVGIALALCYPFSFDYKKFALEVYYPYFDVLQSPFYELFFLLHAFVVVPIFCCVYLPFTNILFAFLMFGEVILFDLRMKLNNISEEDDDEMVMLEKLKNCIAYHQKIIDFRNDLNNLVSIVNFFDVALFGLMFCMLLFYMSMEFECQHLSGALIVSTFYLFLFKLYWQVQELQQILTAVVFISFSFGIIAITYYYANKFTNESIKVCDAAYNTPWNSGNAEMRKCVLIMIARSQKPLHITAGGLYPMTLETFQVIVRISYSYFSILQGFNQQ